MHADRIAVGSQWWTWALAGPAALGAVVGLRHGAWAVAGLSTLLPAVVVGVAGVVVPSLYVIGSFAGLEAPAARFSSAVKSAMRAVGLVVLGLVPTVFVIAATLPDDGVASRAAQVLGAIVLGFAALVGQGWLFRHLQPRRAGLAVFVAWSVVSLGLGLRMYLGALDTGWGW